MQNRVGLILAGGSGTRLNPITFGISKQLLPIYNKPMIYYPLSLLMLAGIRKIAIITTPHDQDQFIRLLGDGSQWGLELTFLRQPSPDGLAQAFLIGQDFINEAPSTLVLGDNILYGHGLTKQLKNAAEKKNGGTIFGYEVNDPKAYGVMGFDRDGKVTSIVEKPEKPASNFAIPGLYFLDGTASEKAAKIKPSPRGELEITSLLEAYLEEGSLTSELLGRGYSWLDAGTFESLLDAGNFVRTLESRQRLHVSCPEEIAFDNDWISALELEACIDRYPKNSYGDYLRHILASSLETGV